MSKETELIELVQDLFNEGFNSIEGNMSDIWQDAWVKTILDVVNGPCSYIECKEHPNVGHDLVLMNLDILRKSGNYNDDGEYFED